MDGFTIAVRTSSGRVSVQLPQEATFGDLRAAIETQTGVSSRKQDVAGDGATA